VHTKTLADRSALARKAARINRNWLYGYLFILPTVGAFVLFSLIPTLAVFVLSLFKWDLVSDPEFLGLDNFIRLFNDPLFLKSLRITFTYVLYNIPVQYVISLLLVLGLNRPLRGVKAFRVIYLVPWVTTPVAIAIVWKWVLNPSTGVLNYLIELLGGDRINWFSSAMAMKSVRLHRSDWNKTGLNFARFFS
jgi:multiple sugar transport system permease protein